MLPCDPIAVPLPCVKRPDGENRIVLDGALRAVKLPMCPHVLVGAIALDREPDLRDYVDPLSRRAARQLLEAEVWRYDGSSWAAGAGGECSGRRGIWGTSSSEVWGKKR